jgi:hypothetical protein
MRDVVKMHPYRRFAGMVAVSTVICSPSGRARIGDPRVRKLAHGIIEAQVREMKALSRLGREAALEADGSSQLWRHTSLRGALHDVRTMPCGRLALGHSLLEHSPLRHLALVVALPREPVGKQQVRPTDTARHRRLGAAQMSRLLGRRAPGDVDLSQRCLQ